MDLSYVPPEQELSYSLALRAEKEYEADGKASTVCPECGKPPVVRIEPGRLLVRCPCGFVYNSEICG